MNIVIPFRNTCGTQELKLCVKLIEKNMSQLSSHIYILGDEIDFEHPMVENIVVKEQKYNKWLDSNFLVNYFITLTQSSQSFYLFNDDFFITSHITEEDIKCYHFSTLEERILTTYVIEPKTSRLRLSSYGLNIQRFLDLFGNFENYEVHIPMPIIYPQVMAEAISMANNCDCPALKRTCYVKLLQEKGLVAENEKQALPHDIKFGEPLRVLQKPFFSLTDTEYKAFEDEFNKILEQ